MLPTPITASASRRRFSKNAWWIDVQRAHLLVGVDHARDVALGRALGDRADVDVVAAERAEHLPRDARPPLHPVADDRHDRLVGRVIEPRQLLLQLEPELVLRSRRSPRPRPRLRTREADRVLGRGLRDQDDVDAPRRQRAEQPLGGARHADHARAAQRQQRDVADRADALGDQRLVVARCARNARARRVDG